MFYGIHDKLARHLESGLTLLSGLITHDDLRPAADQD
jgi:hypothetical protein